jgi:hypothetical protein
MKRVLLEIAGGIAIVLLVSIGTFDIFRPFVHSANDASLMAIGAGALALAVVIWRLVLSRR